MHIGNLRTALFAYLFAKSQNGKFILRIEDTDQGRYVEGSIDVIYDTLRTAGLIHDEGHEAPVVLRVGFPVLDLAQLATCDPCKLLCHLTALSRACEVCYDRFFHDFWIHGFVPFVQEALQRMPQQC